MHVVAFAPSLRAVLDEGGGVSADGFPLTSCQVGSFPAQIAVPVVIALYTQGGTDYDPRRYIGATSPQHERISSLECAWHWPDKPGVPVKHWVMTRTLPMVVQTAGVYTIGWYDTPDGTETNHVFPFPVLKANPFNPPPAQPTTRM